MFKYLFLFVCKITCISCKPSKKGLDYFFEQAEQNIDEKDLAEFKRLPLDSVWVFTDQKLDHNLSVLFKDTTFDNEFHNYFNRMEIDRLLRFRFAMLAFHEHLNNRTYLDSDLFKLSKRDFEKSRLPRLLNTLEEVMKTNWISLVNYNKWKIGDTINIKMPVELKGNMLDVKYTVFASDKITDSLEIKGLLVGKEFKQGFHVDYHFYPSEFDVLILKMSNEKYNRFYFDTIRPLDTINIDLFAYERIIEGTHTNK
jgi:hypothetical protein